MARHLLQRSASPSRSSSLILHLLGITSFSCNFYFLTLWETPITDAYGWHFQFFTIIGLLASLICFTLGAAADFIESPGLFQAKNFVSVFATPLEVVITLMYWGICVVEPTLLIQEGIVLPMLPDLGFHLAPAVFLTLDLIFFSPPWTLPAYGVVSFSAVFAFAYWYWVELCFSKNGWYPYPLFALLDTKQRALLFTFTAVLVTVSSSILKYLYARVNGYPEAQNEAHKRLKTI